MTPEQIETQVLAATFGGQNLPDFTPWAGCSSFTTLEGIGAARIIYGHPSPTELFLGEEIPRSSDIASFCVLPGHQGKHRAADLLMRVVSEQPYWVEHLTAIIDNRPLMLLQHGLAARGRVDALGFLRSEPFEYLGTPVNWAIALRLDRLR